MSRLVTTGPSKCTALGPAFLHKPPNAIEMNVCDNNAPAFDLFQIDRSFEYNQFRKKYYPLDTLDGDRLRVGSSPPILQQTITVPARVQDKETLSRSSLQQTCIRNKVIVQIPDFSIARILALPSRDAAKIGTRRSHSKIHYSRPMRASYPVC
jgi:hypothetical protein